MSDTDESDILVVMRAHAAAGYGDIYRWLKKNRRKVRAGFKSTGSGWDGVVAAIAKEGVTGRNGQAPNRNSVRRVWTRLCSDLEAAAQARAAAKTKKPVGNRSQHNPNWQPPLTGAPRIVPALLPRQYEPEQQPPPRPPLPTPPSQAPPEPSKPIPIEDLPPEVREMFERVKGELREDNYKKFGRF